MMTRLGNVLFAAALLVLVLPVVRMVDQWEQRRLRR